MRSKSLKLQHEIAVSLFLSFEKIISIQSSRERQLRYRLPRIIQIFETTNNDSRTFFQMKILRKTNFPKKNSKQKLLMFENFSLMLLVRLVENFFGKSCVGKRINSMKKLGTNVNMTQYHITGRCVLDPWLKMCSNPGTRSKLVSTWYKAIAKTRWPSQVSPRPPKIKHKYLHKSWDTVVDAIKNYLANKLARAFIP